MPRLHLHALGGDAHLGAVGEQLAALERMGEKSAGNLLEGIAASRERPLWRWGVLSVATAK